MTPVSSNRQPPKPQDTFREPSEQELDILTLLLDQDFPGNRTLVEQLATARVRPIDDDGSLEFALDDGPRAEVVRRIPVEAEGEDADGVTIHILLHVLDGAMKELEIFREDSRAVQRLPTREALRPLVL